MGIQIIYISRDRNEVLHKITVCVFGSWNKINPFITKYIKNRQFWNTIIPVSGIPYPYYDLWNKKADIVISSFNNEWALLVHWWQRQAAVEGSLRGDEHAPVTPPAKLCAQFSKAAHHFDEELRQHWYGASYKAKCFPWCLGGTNILSTYCLAYRFSLMSTRSNLKSLETHLTLSLMHPTTNVGMRCCPG